MVLADKAYDASEIRTFVSSRGGWANIPPSSEPARSDLLQSVSLPSEQPRIERFFNRMKHCRRIATRYEKHAANFLAFVKLAAIRLMAAG
jgi:transposase